MDPNETLRQMRELVTEEQERTGDEGTSAMDIVENHGWLVGLVAELDAWITNGGFLPADWDRKDGA